MSSIVLTILPLFILVLVGAGIKLLKIATDEWVHVLNKFALYLSVIPFVVYNLEHTDKNEILNAKLILVNFAVLIAVIFITWAVTRALKCDTGIANTYILSVFFGNIGYIGLPFVTAFYPEGGGMVGLQIGIYTILLFTLGIFLVQWRSARQISAKNIIVSLIKNPLLLSVFVGVALMVFQIKLPMFLDEPLRLLMVGSTPMVLIAIGIFLAQKIKFDRDFWHALAISLLKIVALPAIFLLTAKVFGFGKEFDISILESGMPVGITIFALTDMYVLRAKLVANTIILSTILSAVSLTILTAIVRG